VPRQWVFATLATRCAGSPVVERVKQHKHVVCELGCVESGVRGELNSLGGVYLRGLIAGCIGTHGVYLSSCGVYLRGLIAGCIGTHGVYLSSCGVYLRGLKQGFEASSAQMLARKRCPEVGQLTSMPSSKALGSPCCPAVCRKKQTLGFTPHNRAPHRASI
jgi:hypothetical protein